MAEKKRVLFVCMGNICRSPAGEGIFKSLVEERGLEGRIEVDSAGTIAYHVGESPDRRMQAAANRRGYQLDSRGRHFQPPDFETFDLIIAMDRNNLRDILKQDPKKQYHDKVRLLSDFHSRADQKDVPDPYYGGEAGFELVLDLIEEACEGILEHMLQEGTES
ncbi:low molecular weight phosphotyrosine protein phosphatase [bacterium]|nr:low molecular weight phosphotyrosine protein phosphatase [bacterium]